MTKAEIRQVRKSLKHIEALKESVSQKRDDLRHALYELEDLLNDWETGVDDLEHGVQAIRSAIETLSFKV